MRPFPLTLPLLVLAIAAGCEKKTDESVTGVGPSTTAPAPPPVPQDQTHTGKEAPKATRELPHYDPLTTGKALEILHAQLIGTVAGRLRFTDLTAEEAHRLITSPRGDSADADKNDSTEGH